MHFRKFTIENYRAVDLAEVPVGNRLIPLIGINESGKTSILKAILAFDRLSDKYGGSKHIDFKNKYVVGTHSCTVTADLVISSEDDLDAISDHMNLTRGDKLIKELEEVFQTKRSIYLHRVFNGKKKAYSISGIESSPNKHKALAKAIYEQLPLILYFDDFADRVPEVVAFSHSAEESGYKLIQPKLAEWKMIIEEVFLRATDGNHSLSSFLKIHDSDDQDGLLNDINDALDHEIMSDWRRLRQSRESLGDDSTDLELELRYRRINEEKFEFRFKVTDRSRDKKRFFDVVDRSKGFQWFFNFLMKLKFNPKYHDDQSGAIYLLDEPGSYLHSSAQEELLKELEQISHTNTILYCTHSQHLLDPATINVGQTRIISKEKGKIRVVPFGSASTDKYQGALSPLFQALHMRTGVFNRKVNRAVVTEGITDFYFFEMLRKNSIEWEFPNIDIIPGAGAGNLKELISWCIAWTDRYLILLDSDSAGLEAKKRYENFFGAGEVKNFITYSTPDSPENVKLEDFLSEHDKKNILKATDAKHIKSGITQLFYSTDEVISEIFDSLDETTNQNLSTIKVTLERLNED